ncbi:MAG: hypothetical protein JXP37_04940 [Coriobacteriia bacterium]|nr:hypothetical protein [Coriobacteriia bacterium]
MNERNHVWHDPAYPPNQVITDDPIRNPKTGKTARRILWIVLGVVAVLALIAVVGVAAIFGSAVMAGVSEGIREPTMPSAYSVEEEEAVRGLATVIADRGKRGDFEAVIEMGDDSDHLDRDELAADVSEAFSDFDIKDWTIDYQNAQVLIDQQTKERILVFRIVLRGADDSTRATNPFYAVDVDGTWRLTGIGGREVVEDVY